MVDFKFQLNRQGVRGQRGEKGDTGFSPVISEKTNTDTEYVLHIQNETDETSFDTPNLKEGLIPEDLGGTVVRYNRETGKQYYGEIDNATEEVAGVVKLEPELTTLNPRSETSVLTAQAAADHYASLAGDNSFTGENGFVKGISVKSIIGNDPDGLTIVQNNESKISLTDYAVSIGRNTLPLILNGTTVTKNGNEVLSVADVDGTTIKIQDGKLHVIGGGGGSGDVTAAGDNTFTGNNVFNGQVVFESGVCNANKAEYLTEEDVDNQTIQVVDGKLHANLDELGNEVNDLSGRVTATEADILTLKTSVSMKQTKLTAGNNITLTDLSDGTVCIDSTGGGGTGDIPIATTTTAGKVKPDGKRITVADDGTIDTPNAVQFNEYNYIPYDRSAMSLTVSGTQYRRDVNFSIIADGYGTLRGGQITLTSMDTNLPNRNGVWIRSDILSGNDTDGYTIGDHALYLSYYSGYNLYSTHAAIGGGTNGRLKIFSDPETYPVMGLEFTENNLAYRKSDGTKIDLLAGGTPTVIDGGDSTTT